MVCYDARVRSAHALCVCAFSLHRLWGCSVAQHAKLREKEVVNMDLEVEASSTSKPRPLLTCSFCNQAAASLVDQAASPLHVPNALLDGRGGK